VKIAALQLNSCVGDLVGNAAAILDAYDRACDDGAALAVTPELALTGYPPEDLLLRDGFVVACQSTIASMCAHVGAVPLIVGAPRRDGVVLHNSAFVIRDGRITQTYDKRILPNYGPFDERRYFTPGSNTVELLVVDGASIALTICEDLWTSNGPLNEYASLNPDVVVSLNSSPFDRTKYDRRVNMLRDRSEQCNVPIVYVNAVGGQDELVFDGGSLLFQNGSVADVAPTFQEAIAIFDFSLSVAEVRPSPDSIGDVWHAIVLGTRDYVRKNGFRSVLIGLSGGIDSALVAVVASHALGPDNVHCVAMPSRYTSQTSIDDAATLAKNLGVNLREISIQPLHQSAQDTFGPVQHQLTDENLQSRLRGLVLMGLSNEHGHLVLTTGNKSELAVGYSTLYGDTAGAFAPIKDLYKTEVYEIVDWLNRTAPHEVVPRDIIDKAPTAELRPNQTDQDSLPPYDVLDPILRLYIEGDQTKAQIVADGFDPELVDRICGLVDRAEYKRRQSPIGVKVATKAFGKDRRMPITNRFPG
jgi:NAD+ synthase (glutamine-hydrolysing)